MAGQGLEVLSAAEPVSPREGGGRAAAGRRRSRLPRPTAPPRSGFVTTGRRRLPRPPPVWALAPWRAAAGGSHRVRAGRPRSGPRRRWRRRGEQPGASGDGGIPALKRLFAEAREGGGRAGGGRFPGGCRLGRRLLVRRRPGLPRARPWAGR